MKNGIILYILICFKQDRYVTTFQKYEFYTMLAKMFQSNDSKFVILLEYENPCNFLTIRKKMTRREGSWELAPIFWGFISKF